MYDTVSEVIVYRNRQTVIYCSTWHQSNEVKLNFIRIKNFNNHMTLWAEKLYRYEASLAPAIHVSGVQDGLELA